MRWVGLGQNSKSNLSRNNPGIGLHMSALAVLICTSMFMGCVGLREIDPCPNLCDIEGDDGSISDWSSSDAAERTGVAVCTSTWKIVDVVSGDESTYAACHSASVRPQPERTYYSSSNRLAVYFIGKMTSSSGVVQSTPAAATDNDDDEHHHQQQRQREHSERTDAVPLQLLHYTG